MKKYHYIDRFNSEKIDTLAKAVKDIRDIGFAHGVNLYDDINETLNTLKQQVSALTSARNAELILFEREREYKEMLKGNAITRASALNVDNIMLRTVNDAELHSYKCRCEEYRKKRLSSDELKIMLKGEVEPNEAAMLEKIARNNTEIRKLQAYIGSYPEFPIELLDGTALEVKAEPEMEAA